MRTLVLIPTYNEAENIKKLIENIFRTVNDISILVIDDNSPDNTAQIVKELILNNNLYILHRDEKKGLASAYIEGMKWGLNKGYDTFIEMDADFSHNPAYLPEMIKYLKTHDLVIGSRNIKTGSVIGWSIFRNLISKCGSLYSKIILGCPINDLTGGFNGWNADILNKINLDNIISEGYCFQIEMKYKAYKNNAKFIEFPIIFENRKYGHSKMNKKIFFEAFFNVLKIRNLSI